MDEEETDERPNARRHYSDRQKAEALLVLEATGERYSATSRQTGVPRANLYAWKQDRGMLEDQWRQIDEQRPLLANQFQELAERLVADALANKDRIDRANIQQVTTAAGIAVDKMRLLREQATHIRRDERMDDVEKLKRVLALLDEQQPALEAYAERADEEQEQQPIEQQEAGCSAPASPLAGRSAEQQQQEQPASPIAGYYTGRLPGR